MYFSEEAEGVEPPTSHSILSLRIHAYVIYRSLKIVKTENF